MGLMVSEVQAVGDGALPLTELAAQMRLPEGYDAIPGQDVRLRARLRAAIEAVERQLGLILLSREVVATGVYAGAGRLRLPVGPVTALVSVETVRGGVATPLIGAAVEGERLVVPGGAGGGATLRVVLRAGFADWAAVPAPIAQAVLALAEALDDGLVPEVTPVIRALIAPWRRMRIGGPV